MDLNMTNLWFHGKEHIAASSFSQAEPAAINCRSEELAVAAVNLGCLGSSETAQTSRKSFQQSIQSLAVPDDGCRLVLGLGPTPNLYSSDSHSYGGNKANESATFRTQHCTAANPGLQLGLPRCSSRKNGITIPLIDEGSTSAKRKVGGYVLPLLFAPRSEDLCPNGTPSETNVQQHKGTRCDSEDDPGLSLNHHEVEHSPDLSITTDCSFAATSDMVVSTTSGEQRSHQHHPKKCRFNGCSKGARGASGLCISHGGGQRCQKPGCNKGAESRTAYCKAHGGGKRCQELGCTKSAEGKTEFCIAHGGGSRCGIQGCAKAARGRSGFCIKHGGGKRCRIEGCTRSAEGQPGLCISHGGGRRCQYPNCSKGAQGSTIFCKSHGGGKRCMFEGCTRGAEGSTPFCKGHGGGKRCLFEGGGVCPKSVHGGTSFCVAHGGGKRCTVTGCTKSARGRSDCCVRHGGGKRCRVDGCDKSAQGNTDFCKAHGGGKRCAWSTGCEKFARGRSGLCAAHATVMASKQDHDPGQGRSMFGPGFFSGVVSTSSAAGTSMDHGMSSSGHGAWSDSNPRNPPPVAASLLPPPNPRRSRAREEQPGRMPPKKAQPSKADLAKKQKVVEDKTFGLKNKNKSKNVQKYVQSLHQAVHPKPDPSKTAAKKKKEEEKAREKELNDLFKVAVSQPKVPVGVDPKSILCEFFKVGQCQKGFKCKFSHDLNVQRKGEKIDIYTDKRDADTMEDWDQETLEKVVESKKTEYQQNKPTDIVCKYFLDAVEKKQYGWFWVCPNGGKDCHYRHALPPGYILKSQMKALLEEESEKIAIEDEIEDQRKKTKTSTPMTTELFMEWKRKKAEEKEAGQAALRAERAKNDRMSGRELFMADASVFVDDAEAYEVYERDEEPGANDEPAKKTQDAGPSSSTSNGKQAEEPDEDDIDIDDDLDLDELNELEASLSRTSIQIREPGEGTSS